MVAVEDLLNDILRPSDEIKVVLEAVLAQPSSGTNLHSPGAHDPHHNVQNRCVLAVISHKDDWNLTEEGSLFVCRYKLSAQDELEIFRLLPIYGSFSIVMTQTRHGSIDLRPDTGKAAHDQSRSGFSLTVTPAEGLHEDAPQPTFSTHDIHQLRSLVAECRRLKEVSDLDANTVVNLAQSTTHFSWLKPYVFKQVSLTGLAILPQDLRIANLPLVDRLSSASAGHLGNDSDDIQIIRDEWIRVKARVSSRRGRRRLKLRLGTFNVNGKFPSQDLSVWIQGQQHVEIDVDAKSEEKPPEPSPVKSTGYPSIPPLKSISPLSLGDVIKNPFDWIRAAPNPEDAVTPDPEQQEKETEIQNYIAEPVDPSDPGTDMFVLAFQELDLSAEALIYSTSTAREDAWCLAIFAALGEKAVRYEKLVSKQLVGMLIVVIVKTSLKECFGEVKTSAAGAGILGVMGNKGGTAVHLTFTPHIHASEENASPVKSVGPTTMTFVNAHLAAFDEMVDRRNSDFQDLSKRLEFEGTRTSRPPTSESEDSILDAVTPTTTVYESDVLFWMGDLNYRVDIPDADLRRILGDGEWEHEDKLEALFRFDQLKKAMQTKNAFDGFTEHPITHLPTYRFSVGLTTDLLGYDFKRKPAWTDRILYIPGPACQVNQLSYTSYPQIKMSDHRPVSADFTVDVDLYDKDERYDYAGRFYGELDYPDGSHERGGLTVDHSDIDFGKLSYGKRITKTVKVQNTGKGPCAFRFIPVQIDSPIHAEWLSIYPMAGLLLPKEVAEITLTAYVDNEIASLLNRRPRDLNGTLILHTVMGKDHFILVSGEYQYTCFANTLSKLTQLPGPIRALESANDLLEGKHRKNAPNEVIRLVNWLMSNTANTDNLFISTGDEDLVVILRECLDTGAEFPYSVDTSDPKIPLAFATALLCLLDSLVEPVIPASVHSRCIEMTNRDEAFELLDLIPPASVNVWISVTAFLHFICQSSGHENQAERIAAIFAPVFLRDDPTSTTPPISPQGKRKFLLFFIG